MSDKNELLQILVDANRLNKALINRNDFTILIKNRDVIGSLADYEEWVKEIYDSKEIKEFKHVLKFLDEEAAFLKKKQSSKESVIRSYKKSLNKAYFKLLATFKFLLNEIHQHEQNIANNMLLEENLMLRKIVGWKGELRISKYTAGFIYDHRKDFKKIDQEVVEKTDAWINDYVNSKGDVPKNIKQLKEFIG
jgi:hypothetical protein